MLQTTEATTDRRSWLHRSLFQIVRLVLAGLFLGWVYAWASPIVYPQQTIPGFWLGSAHGALMPMALPSLLMGKDVPIYAEKNSGSSYKIGYIAGINVCGFVFFGLSFWKRGRTDTPRQTSSRFDQKSQLQ